MFQPIRDVLRFSNETGKKKIRSFGLDRHDTMMYSLRCAITYLEIVQ